MQKSWADRLDKLKSEDAAKAIQSLSFLDDEGRKALASIEARRGVRNLLAHFALKRFPSDEAFVCLAKSARDYERQFGRLPAPGEMLSAVIDRQQLLNALKHVEHVQNWLARVTVEVERKFAPRPN